jgi:outer membrane protein OmpA-like peptidoglycan-associated protein
MLKITSVSLLSATLLLTGCATTQNPNYGANTSKGVAIGAVTGAALGALANGTGPGIALGVAMGSITGGAIGNAADRRAAELQTKLQGTGITVSHHQDTVELLMPSDVTFKFDSADINPKFYPALNIVAKFLQDHANVTANVAGHTDSIGTKAYNQDLSERRAASVAAYLEKQGVNNTRLTTQGYGMTKPVASNKTKAGRAQNRRVEVDLK